MERGCILGISPIYIHIETMGSYMGGACKTFVFPHMVTPLLLLP